MDATDEKEQRRLHELHRWHMHNFVSLGFGRDASEALDLANVDWHDAQNLLKRGCSHEAAMLILI